MQNDRVLSGRAGKLQVALDEDCVAKLGQADNQTFQELAKLGFRLTELDLQGDVSFVFVEPTPASAGGQAVKWDQLLGELLDRGGLRLAEALSLLDNHREAEVRFDWLRLAKIELENSIDLMQPLRAMGLGRVFAENSSELAQILQGQRVFVSQAKHQALIEVNESGIKATGVTMLTISERASLPSERVRDTVHPENPSMFLLRHERVPFFVGQ